MSAGGGRKAARLRRLKGRLDNLKKQVEKLRECVNNGKMNIYELREKLANLEKLCKQDQCGKLTYSHGVICPYFRYIGTNSNTASGLCCAQSA